MSQGSMRKLTKASVKKLYQDLREVFGQYDLEILVNDGVWLKNEPLADSLYLHVRPFALDPKRAYYHEARTAEQNQEAAEAFAKKEKLNDPMESH